MKYELTSEIRARIQRSKALLDKARKKRSQLQAVLGERATLAALMTKEKEAAQRHIDEAERLWRDVEAKQKEASELQAEMDRLIHEAERETRVGQQLYVNSSNTGNDSN